MLYGPFDEVITLDGLPDAGPIKELTVIKEGAILVEDGKIKAVGTYSDLKHRADSIVHFERPVTCVPAFIDAHTHMCFAGNRIEDYEKKLAGKSYQELGGIMTTVKATRAAKAETLLDGLRERLKVKLRHGCSTVEIKSGYGLDFENEIKMLTVINLAKTLQPLTIVPTLLAAHTLPPEFTNNKEYLDWIATSLVPEVKNLTSRVDIFCDECAFSVEEAEEFLKKVKLTPVVHADQFTKGGSALKALSADHLEVSDEEEFLVLKKNGTIPIVLPGASLGLGLPFAKARRMLDLGLPLAIASDWNPGSAPSGDLLMQAAVLGIYEKLSMAETFAGITFRAARALGLHDRGQLKRGQRADFTLFPTNDYREILYSQGSLKPKHTVIEGEVYSFIENIRAD